MLPALYGTAARIPRYCSIRCLLHLIPRTRRKTPRTLCRFRCGCLYRRAPEFHAACWNISDRLGSRNRSYAAHTSLYYTCAQRCSRLPRRRRMTIISLCSAALFPLSAPYALRFAAQQRFCLCSTFCLPVCATGRRLPQAPADANYTFSTPTALRFTGTCLPARTAYHHLPCRLPASFHTARLLALGRLDALSTPLAGTDDAAVVHLTTYHPPFYRIADLARNLLHMRSHATRAAAYRYAATGAGHFGARTCHDAQL